MKEENKSSIVFKDITLKIRSNGDKELTSQSFTLANFSDETGGICYFAWEIKNSPDGFYFSIYPAVNDNNPPPAVSERIRNKYITPNNLMPGMDYVLKTTCPFPDDIEEFEVTVKPLASLGSNDYRKPSLIAQKILFNPPGLPSAEDYAVELKNARRGRIDGTALTDCIAGPSIGQSQAIAWDIPSYDFLNDLDARTCTTIHPNLLRQEQMNNVNGLFVVSYDNGLSAPPPDEQLSPDNEKHKEIIGNATILQLRSYDLATMSFVRGKSGWIVIDPLGGEENVRKGLAQFRRIFPSGNAENDENRIVAVLVTHSHVDHYRGIQALTDDCHKLILPGRVHISRKEGEEYETISYTTAPEANVNPATENILYVAPVRFYDEAVSENLYLGNSMTRRSAYMYGRILPHDERGHVGSGLGKTVGDASGALYKPSVEIDFEAGEVRKVMIDGLHISFLDAHDSEAPSEYHIYFEDYHTLCPGENITHTMHNLLTCRGAKIRNPKAFSQAIDRSLEEWEEDIQTIIGTHHWPVWGNKECCEIMKSQRDMYRFFNDQVIHGINRGLNMEEIAEQFVLPPSLASKCYNRGYYGSLNHNVKAVFQFYVGWWDGNPVNYFRYPETEAARRFVDCMGGAAEVLKKARDYFAKDDYRWAMELTRQIVFALGTQTENDTTSDTPDDDPGNTLLRKACFLQADAMEQLAYGFEAGTWRNIFLSGAKELREGRHSPTPMETLIENCVARLAVLEPEQTFEYLSILVDGRKMAGPFGMGKEPFIEFYVQFADTEPSTYCITLCHGVLHAKIIPSTKMSDKVPLLTYNSMKGFADAFGKAMRKANDLPEAEGETLQAEESTPDVLTDLCRYLELPEENWEIVFS